MKVRAHVDRVEEDWAVLVVGDRAFDFPRSALPPNLAEGAVLEFQITCDPSAERATRDHLEQRVDRLTGDDDGGDFEI